MPVAVYQPHQRDTGAQGLAALVSALDKGSDIYNKNFGDEAKKRAIELENAQDAQDKAQSFAESGADVSGPGLAEHILSGKVLSAKPTDKGAFGVNVQVDPYQKRMMGQEQISNEDPRYAQATPVAGPDGRFEIVNMEKRFVRPASIDAAEAKKREIDPVAREIQLQRLQDMKDRKEEAKTKRTEDKAEKLSGKLQHAGELNTALNTIEKTMGFTLDSYDPDTNSVDGKPIDLPGVNLPLAGRVSFYDSDARKLRDQMAKVFNVELKDRSGTAVTNNEMERIKNEFGSGKLATEADMIRALKDYKSAFYGAVKNIEAGYSPEARDMVSSRGGFTSADLPGGEKQKIVKSDYEKAVEEKIKRKGMSGMLGK